MIKKSKYPYGSKKIIIFYELKVDFGKTYGTAIIVCMQFDASDFLSLDIC